jgi:hypothetical protein
MATGSKELLQEIKRLTCLPITTLSTTDKTAILDALDDLYQKVLLVEEEDINIVCNFTRKQKPVSAVTNANANANIFNFAKAVATDDYAKIDIMTNVGVTDAFWEKHSEITQLITRIDTDYNNNYYTDNFISGTFAVNNDKILLEVFFLRLARNAKNNNNFYKFANQYDTLKKIAGCDVKLMCPLKQVVVTDLHRYINHILSHHLTLGKEERDRLHFVLNKPCFKDVADKYPVFDKENGFMTAFIVEQRVRTEYLAGKKDCKFNEIKEAYDKDKNTYFLKLVEGKRTEITNLNKKVDELIKKKKTADPEVMKPFICQEIKRLRRLKSYYEQLIGTLLTESSSSGGARLLSKKNNKKII